MTSLRDTDTTAYPDAMYLACSEAPMPRVRSTRPPRAAPGNC
ncbi:hypothetical protein I543_0522 [Mycobacteroides abscessus 21]|uniref:Uncharacterized protein n=1 Tax=Mycobacteroides abscessus 21 TaxID=1299324 RepID=A0A829Q482_9MYCO|nr:hypothetical protein I543_0522 [Mycobacteroides abscessus 21]